MFAAVGVAVFEDGRIAFKEFVFAGDTTEDGSRGTGYSTYTFQNGDALNFSLSFIAILCLSTFPRGE